MRFELSAELGKLLWLVYERAPQLEPRDGHGDRAVGRRERYLGGPLATGRGDERTDAQLDRAERVHAAAPDAHEAHAQIEPL